MAPDVWRQVMGASLPSAPLPSARDVLFDTCEAFCVRQCAIDTPRMTPLPIWIEPCGDEICPLTTARGALREDSRSGNPGFERMTVPTSTCQGLSWMIMSRQLHWFPRAVGGIVGWRQPGVGGQIV